MRASWPATQTTGTCGRQALALQNSMNYGQMRECARKSDMNSMTKNKPSQELNRVVFEGDNLDVLRGIDSDSMDLVYLDPPFNSNRVYEAPVGSRAAGAAFKDAWTLSDVDLIEHNRLKREHEWLYAPIHAAKRTHSNGMFSYLMMMSPRLFELRRVSYPSMVRHRPFSESCRTRRPAHP